MATPQQLARQELARRELERRRLEREKVNPPLDVDPAEIARMVFNTPDYDDSTQFDVAFAKMKRTPTAKQIKELPSNLASKTGVYAAGTDVIETGVGLAKMYTENFRRAQARMYESLDLPVPKKTNKVVEAMDDWVASWQDNLKWYKQEHPEDFLQLKSKGFINTTLELFSNPLNLLKGGMQSLPLMLEGLLPGGTFMMATSSAGKHYLQNREEGDDPEKAAIRAWVTAVPEAAIETYTLKRKVGLFKGMKQAINTPTRKVMWEMGKAYMRGTGEEGSQQFNENVWRWVFSDRSTDVWQGVRESAAVGGPLEAMFSGTVMIAGSAKLKTVSTEEKINRVNRVREMLLAGVEKESDVGEINEAMDKVITDVKAGKYDQPLTDTQREGADYGLAPKETDEVMNYAESRYQALESKRTKEPKITAKRTKDGTHTIYVNKNRVGDVSGAKTTTEAVETYKRTHDVIPRLTADERAEWEFLRKHRGDFQSLVEISTDPGSELSYVDGEGKPATRNKAQNRNLVKNMEQRLVDQDIAMGKSETEAKVGAAAILEEAIVQVTGKKKSLKSLGYKQLQEVANYMSDFAADGDISPDDLDNFVILNGERVKMRGVMTQAYETSQRAPTVEPGKTSSLTSRIKNRLRKVKNFVAGITNTPMYHLAKRLDGGDENGVYSQVLDKNIQAGHRVEAGFNRKVNEEFRQAMSDAGITEEDLVRMSTDLDPLRSVLRKVAERLPTKLSGTQERVELQLGKRKVKLTMAELIDLYLISSQTDGMRHLIEGGLIVDGENTGPLTPSEIANARDIVESDEKASAVVSHFMNVSNNRWRPAVNATSQALDGRTIAKIDNWWGLEVLVPGEVGGEKTEFNVNLTENKSIFHSRVKSDRPLILRDAFRRFSVFQSAIANYYGLAEPFRIARTLLNSKELWDAYSERGMKDVFEEAQQSLKHAQGMVHSKNVLEGVIDAIMPNVYRALLYYNPKVWMSQYTSVLNYGSYVSNKYMKDVFGSLTNIGDRSLWDEMLSSSDVAYERFHTGQATLELGVAGESDAVRRNLLNKSSWANKAAYMLKAADMGALFAGWQAAKAEFKDAQAGKLEGKSMRWWAGEDIADVQEGSPEYQDMIKRRAEYLWQRTQPSWDRYNRSIITNAPKLLRSFLMFRSFHEKVLTIWNDAAVDYATSEKSLHDATAFADKVSWPIASYITNATMRIIIAYGLYNKREGIEKIVKDVVLAPLDAFPVIGTFIQSTLDAMWKGLRGEQAYLNDDDLESMPLAMLNDTGRSVKELSHGLGKVVSGNDADGKEAKKAASDLITKVAIMNGVPAYQIRGVVGRFTEDESGSKTQKGKVTKTYEREK